jgi:hypothetical protein
MSHRILPSQAVHHRVRRTWSIGTALCENRGQWPETVFRAEMPEATLWCERGSLVIDRIDAGAIARLHAGNTGAYEPDASRVIRHHALRLRFANATGPVRSEGIGVQGGAYNYFIGNDRRHWASNAHAFSAVVQHDLYPGIDLRLRRGGEVLKYDDSGRRYGPEAGKIHLKEPTGSR